MKILDLYKKKYTLMKNLYLIISTLSLLLCFLMKLDVYAKYISILLIIMAIPFLIMEVMSKRFFNTLNMKWIVLFILSYFITILLSAKTDFVSTIHIYIWLIIYMVLFYSSGSECDSNELITYATHYYKVIGAVMFMISSIGVVGFLSQNLIDVEFLFLGGRARSITIDPIQLSWVAYISFTSAITLFTSQNISKRWKWFSAISIVMSLCAIIVSMTRNTEYGALGFIGIMSFLSLYIYYCKDHLKLIKSIFISILIFCLSAFMFSGIKISLNWLSSLPKTESNNKQAQEVNEDLNRTDYQNGVFKYGLSGRFEIWAMGINVVKEYPVFGVSSGDMKYQSVNINKDTQVYKQTYPYFHDKVFISQHNGFMQVLVASGVAGLFFTTIFMILLSYKVLKYIFTRKSHENFYFIASVAANVAVIFYVLSFGQSISYFLLSFISAYFWISLGYLSNFINKEAKEESGGQTFTCE